MAAIRASPWSSVDSMIRAIVSTVSTGYAPTLVSPDSITASAPSRTAFATSEASARVGRDAEIIDSSICVATIAGFALRRAASTRRFCRNGTSSSGISTPRSPRATITPSNAATISSMHSMACGFSILAITGSHTRSSSITERTSAASSADRTNDNAIRSARRPRAQRRSSVSFSLMAGTLTATPGRLIPLLLLSVPPTSTRVTTSVSETVTAVRATRPSSMRIRSPGRTSPGSPSYVVEQRNRSPGTGREVIVNPSPRDRVTGPVANLPSRIFGPCRSTRTPTACPDSSEACRTILYTASWSA